MAAIEAGGWLAEAAGTALEPRCTPVSAADGGGVPDVTADAAGRTGVAVCSGAVTPGLTWPASVFPQSDGKPMLVKLAQGDARPIVANELSALKPMDCSS